jgi:hypothetical protein
MMKRNYLRAALLFIAVASLVIVGACTKRAAAVQPFPASNEAAGWAKTGETRTFTADNLSDYIDGDAVKYIKAGVKSASTADYKYQDKIEATADVYAMSDASGAKTILDSEPATSNQSITLGDAAHVSSQSIVFRKGPYLVRIVAYQETPDVQPALIGLAQGIERKLAQ